MAAAENDEGRRSLQELDRHARRAAADHVRGLALALELAVEEVVPLEQARRTPVAEERGRVGHDERLERTAADRAAKGAVLEDEEAPSDPRGTGPLGLDDSRERQAAARLELPGEVAKEGVVAAHATIVAIGRLRARRSAYGTISPRCNPCG